MYNYSMKTFNFSIPQLSTLYTGRKIIDFESTPYVKKNYEHEATIIKSILADFILKNYHDLHQRIGSEGGRRQIRKAKANKNATASYLLILFPYLTLQEF